MAHHPQNHAETDTVTMEQRIRAVSGQACFSQLTSEELTTLADLLVERAFPPGHTIVQESDPIDSVYFIISGEADVRHITVEKDRSHKVTSVATLKTGDTIGLNESGFYSLTGRRTATVVAKTNMILLQLSVAVFHGFSLANSHVNEVMRNNARQILNIRS